jgi:hypothetical protein
MPLRTTEKTAKTEERPRGTCHAFGEQDRQPKGLPPPRFSLQDLAKWACLCECTVLRTSCREPEELGFGLLMSSADRRANPRRGSS